MLVIAALLSILGLARIATMPLRDAPKVFALIAGAAIWFVVAFRSFDFGFDTTQYLHTFERLPSLSYKDLILGEDAAISKSPAFYILAKVVLGLGVTDRGLMAILAAVFALSVSRTIYRFSSGPFLSYISLISLGFMSFAMMGLRQTLALSVFLWAYGPLKRRRPVRFVLLVLVASLFHSSALVMLVAYPVARKRLGWLQAAVVGVGLLASTVFEAVLRRAIVLFAWSDELASYGAQTERLTWSGFVILALVFTFCVIFSKRTLQWRPSEVVFYNLLALGLAFQAMASVIAEAFRIGIYFNFAACLLVPNVVLQGLPKEARSFAYASVAFALLAYIWWSGAFSDFRLAL